MTATTITLRLEPQPPNALSEDELDALTRALARKLDAPELTAADCLRTMNEAQVEIMTRRLLRLMGG